MASGTLFTGAIPSTAESFTSSIIYVSSPGVREAVIDFPECATYCDQIWATWTVTSAGGIDKRGTGRINPKTCSTMRPGSFATIPNVGYFVKVDFHGTLAGRFKSDSTLTVR